MSEECLLRTNDCIKIGEQPYGPYMYAEILEKEAKKLCDFFKDFQVGEYVKYAATASIGAAVFPKDGNDFESMYKAADSALYTAKKRGKSQLAFYGEENDKSEGIKRVERESKVVK